MLTKGETTMDSNFKIGTSVYDVHECNDGKYRVSQMSVFAVIQGWVYLERNNDFARKSILDKDKWLFLTKSEALLRMEELASSGYKVEMPTAHEL